MPGSPQTDIYCRDRAAKLRGVAGRESSATACLSVGASTSLGVAEASMKYAAALSELLARGDVSRAVG